MKCAFCGKTFDEAAGRAGCQACSLFGGCKNVRCPHCGYESPLEPGWLKKLRGDADSSPGPAAQAACAPEASPPEAAGPAEPLTAGTPGRTGRVAELGTADSAELRKLLAMGLLPGSRLRLLQKSPAYVLQSGFSQFTLDAELAGIVRVCWDRPT